MVNYLKVPLRDGDPSTGRCTLSKSSEKKSPEICRHLCQMEAIYRNIETYAQPNQPWFAPLWGNDCKYTPIMQCTTCRLWPCNVLVITSAHTYHVPSYICEKGMHFGVAVVVALFFLSSTTRSPLTFVQSFKRVTHKNVNHTQRKCRFYKLTHTKSM